MFINIFTAYLLRLKKQDMKQKEIYIPFCDSCAVRSSSVFKNLSKDEIELLNFEKDYKHFMRGELLYSEGNRLSGFFCINKGIIKVFKTGIDGKEQIIRFAKKGDIIAYRSILRMSQPVLLPKLLKKLLYVISLHIF